MSEEAKETLPNPFQLRLEALKRQLWADFGKTTCWQWLCKDRNATTEPEQIAVAEEVLAMPRMGNVAAAQTYWLRLQGEKPFNIDEFACKNVPQCDEVLVTIFF